MPSIISIGMSSLNKLFLYVQLLLDGKFLLLCDRADGIVTTV